MCYKRLTLGFLNEKVPIFSYLNLIGGLLSVAAKKCPTTNMTISAMLY